jgi:ABC-type transport system involved in cytochrome c biogenesis ATPase subunit
MVDVAVNPPSGLFGRTGELETLIRLIVQARSGRSAVLVVRGEPGIGKTELLRHLIAETSGLQVARVAGVVVTRTPGKLGFDRVHLSLDRHFCGRIGFEKAEVRP